MKKFGKLQFEDVLFKCGCGFETTIYCLSNISDDGKVSVPICLNCHAVTTGKRKIVDDGGRMKRFMNRYDEHKNKDDNNGVL